MRISSCFLLRLLALALVFAGALGIAAANEPKERRVALVIGNAAYRAAPALPNPGNDAQDMAAALKALGFEVIDGNDLDRRGMGEALGRFARAANGADAALVFYAGHGLQFRGENFLLPVDAAPSDEFAIPYETTRVADVVDALQNAKGIRILILDACRNNPLADRIASSGRSRDSSIGRGLARMAQSSGMVVAYATQANDVAADGTGRNSPFSAAMLEHLSEPGLEIGQMFRRVAVSVNQRTKGRQTPELSLSLLGDFYFNRAETDLQAWSKVRDSNEAPALRGFIERFPRSYLADAARARIDAVERAKREDTLRRQLAGYEEERRRAAQAAETTRQAEAQRLAAERTERDRLAAAQAETRRKAEEEAARQQAEQRRRLDQRLAELEAENRKVQAELASRAEEQARRARDDRERETQARERERLSAAQTDRLKTAEAEANRQKQEEERRIAERLAKLEEENRRASADLAERFKAEAAIRQAVERDRSRLDGELEAERRRAAEELQRVQREAATAREKAGAAAAGAVHVASLPQDGAAAPVPPPAANLDLAGLTKTINIELGRIGCYRGKPEGEWSSRPTSRAVQEFARLARISPPDAPSTEFLDLLKGQSGRVCPLQCSARQIERDGACVAKSCPSGQRLDAEGDCVAPKPKRLAQPAAEPRQKPRPAPAAPRGGRCFSFNGQSFCE
ncbi:caspase domain-containing protein [Bosea sp. WAO]|uniref:caspase family protein n=1 Tax=Bosea sp. WAO TaxID=406341 RepID=UPI0008304ACF|nr:caspase domain-containing protein [Bosea sp. WAO]